MAKEGPQAVNVLRKTGRSGWAFFNDWVLPHKKKLAAAGVLALFLANPEKFVDSAGRITEFATEQFAKAGIQLITTVAASATKGAESAVNSALTQMGLEHPIFRWSILGLAGLTVIGCIMIIIGWPLRMMFRPLILASQPVLVALRWLIPNKIKTTPKSKSVENPA